jgi:hypothetical protein
VLHVLVKTAVKNKQPFPDSIQYIEYMGEPLLPYYRNEIEKVLPVPSADMYGCTETNGIAYECENRHLHLLQNNVYTEVVDSENNAVLEKPGNVCVTGVHNTVMPFIRYKLNDRAIMHRGQQCGCGNESPYLELLITRLPEFLVFDDKEYCGVGAIYYPINKLNIMRPCKSDVLFHLKLVNLKTYKITFFNRCPETAERQQIESCFRGVMARYGLSNIDFTFAYAERQEEMDVGVLRIFG